MREAAGDQAVSALLVGEFKTDRLLVHDVFKQSGWRLFEASDRRHAMQCLDRHPVQVVIAESDVRNWNWKRVLSDLRRFPRPPQLIVSSRTADDYLWAEVLNVGGYDVLPRPFERDEVQRVIAAARRHYDIEPKRPITRQPVTTEAGAA
jgi:DNA-binding response OmpR family regulator